MIKTLSSINKQEKEKFKIPKKVQHIIPIETLYGKMAYSK